MVELVKPTLPHGFVNLLYRLGHQHFSDDLIYLELFDEEHELFQNC